MQKQNKICSLIISFILFTNNLSLSQTHHSNEINLTTSQSRNSNPPSLIVDMRNQTVITTNHYHDVSPDTVAQIIQEHNSENPSTIPTSEIIVSTDKEQVVDSILTKSGKATFTKEPKFLFFGSILSTSPINKIGHALGNKITSSVNHIISSAKSDKVGLLVVTINTAYDSYLWIHAESISVTQSTAQVILGLILAVSFGLDKDLWSKMTKPLERKVQSSMAYLGLIHNPKNSFDTHKLVSQFFANLTFSAGLQVLRMGIISIDHIAATLQTSHFWLTSFLIGFALTASSFSWSEQLAKIDINKFPVAKNVMRRVTDLRNLALGHIAPSGKILQPDVYGYTSWVALGISALAGLVVWIKSDSFINSIERSKLLNRYYLNIQKIEKIITRVKHHNSEGLFCNNLFN